MKKIKSFVALMMVCAIMFSAFATTVSATTHKTFDDVRKNSWYFNAVQYCRFKGYINGTSLTTFKPHDNITREQIVVILANIEKVNYNQYKNTNTQFTDVATGKWYSGAIAWASDLGYTVGINETTFGLGQALTRGELVTFLYRIFGKNESVNIGVLDNYEDKNQTSSWNKDAFAWAISKGIVTSVNDDKLVLNPKGNATRAQIATMLMNYDLSKEKVTTADKDRLYEHMMSIFEEPKLELIEKPTLMEYANTIREGAVIPEECAHIYEWMFSIINDETLDGNERQSIEINQKVYNAFVNSFKNVIFYNPSIHTEEDTETYTPVKFYVTKNEMINSITKYYDMKCALVDDANESSIKEYNDLKAYFDREHEYVKTACDLVVEATKKSGAIGKSETEAINLIVKYLCDNCEYWYWGAEEGAGLGRWVRECLQDGHAVCDGYAKSFYLMCYYLGIDVKYYDGVTNTGEGHAWNSININGTEYYFDTTWHDIQLTSTIKDKNVWCPYEEFSKTHIKDREMPTFW